MPSAIKHIHCTRWGRTAGTEPQHQEEDTVLPPGVSGVAFQGGERFGEGGGKAELCGGGRGPAQGMGLVEASSIRSYALLWAGKSDTGLFKPVLAK